MMLTVLAGAWGCDSFESNGEDTANEAGAEVSIDPFVEAGTDAPSVDADAGFCPPNAFLCDDFERETLLGPWGTNTGDPDAAADASQLAIDTAHYTSPSRSLRSDPRSGVGAALAKLLPSPASVDVSFSLRVEANTPAAVYLMTVELTTNDGYVQIILQNGELQLLEQLRSADGGEYYLPERATDAPIGKFARYTLRVDRASNSFVLLAEGGKELSRRTLVQPHGSISRLYVGATYNSAESSSHWIDDVVVTTTK
jgi:hypothetical protein